jgi:hypothetical protein
MSVSGMWSLNVVESWPHTADFCTYTATCCYDASDCYDSLPNQTMHNCGINALLEFGIGGENTTSDLSIPEPTSATTITNTWNPDAYMTGGYTLTLQKQ